MMRAGGSYKTDKSGKTKLVEPATKDHPKGNRAREKDQKNEPTRVVEKPAKRGGK